MLNKLNNYLAISISNKVGTIYCAYIFAVIGLMGIVGAFTSNTKLVLIVGSISGYFLQLVLLPIIMVAQKLQADTTIKHLKKHHAEHMKELAIIKKHLKEKL